MGSQKQRQERLSIMADKWKTNKVNGCSEALNRKMCEDYMIQIWYMGYQTRQDYLEVLQSLEFSTVLKE
jgi:hypothetical protein